MRMRIFSLVLLCIFGVSLPLAGSPQDSWESYWNRKQPPAKYMDSIGIEAGMSVGEFGAGRGRYAVKAAERLGKSGTMYANDIADGKLEYLEHRCNRDGISNIVVVRGTFVDPRFPKVKLDVVYCINTYHHIDQPVELLKNVIPALKPGGILAIIEHDPRKVTDMGNHCTPKETVLKQAEAAGFRLLRIETFPQMDNIYVFKVKK
ncbi:MAG: methyltransferase domain-containing protein [bacterium]|nr:methyltransferase domain-containing protein [bacterium]